MASYLTGEDALWAYNFSTNLKEQLRLKSISASEVARRTGIAQYKMMQYRNGGAIPSEEELKDIASAIDCDIAVLTDETNAPWKFGSDED